ncbi:MAG: hypothetical protein N3A55_10300, partial [Methylohalobius sp.]|nr:hypothetical protein [Methylohalobius sp.]
MLFHRASGLEGLLRGCLEVHGSSVRIVDAHRLREQRLDALLYNALFQPEEKVRYFLCWLIRQAAAGNAIHPASLGGLYAKVARGQAPKFTIPTISLHAMPYWAGRSVFRAMREVGCGAVALSLDGSAESAPSPLEYATCLLAAAMREGYEGPVFLEADFLCADSDQTGLIQELLEGAINAGFFNVLLDPRRLEDLTHPDPSAQVEASYTFCAALASFVRQIEPQGVGSAISIRFGLGDANTALRLRAFVEGFDREFVRRAGHVPGISRFDLNVRSELDLDAAVELAEVARREYLLPTGVDLPGTSFADEWLEALVNMPFAQVHLGDWLKARVSAILGQGGIK